MNNIPINNTNTNQTKYILYKGIVSSFAKTNSSFIDVNITSILNKLTGIYVYEEGISTQDFQSFQRYTTDLTLEYDKINKIYKTKKAADAAFFCY